MVVTYDATLSRPIFVVGYMHSGTTLLFNVLRRNAAVFSAGGETNNFAFLPMFRRTYPNLDDDRVLQDFIVFLIDLVQHGYDLRKMRDAEHKAPTMASEYLDHLREILPVAKQHKDHGLILRLVFDHLARTAGKTRWLTKTQSFVTDEIVRCMPDAQFVEIVRDPRDVLASKKSRRLTVWGTDRYRPEQRPFKNLEKAYDPLWDTLAWKSAVQASRSAEEKYPSHVCSIRYEDLVVSPRSQIEKICAFLNLEFEPEMLSISSRNAAEWRKGESDKTRGIVPVSVGRWRQVLSPAEVALCQWLVEAEMDELGYSCVPIDLVHRVNAPVLMGKSVFKLIARIYKRWRLGGFPYLVNITIGYWRRLLKLIHGWP